MRINGDSLSLYVLGSMYIVSTYMTYLPTVRDSFQLLTYNTLPVEQRVSILNQQL